MGSMSSHLPTPPVPPRLYAPNPRDEYTPGTIAWVVIIGAGTALELYGIHYDKTHPGNRRKWTLTSNMRPLGGFDSVTGLPLDVPFGALRRAALVFTLAGVEAWLTHHWTSPIGRY
jgi:hypothetical protein